MELGEKLFNLVTEEQRKERKLQERLTQIEYLVGINSAQALLYLEFEILHEKNSSLSPLVHFLQGLCLFQRKKLLEAADMFTETIELITNQPELNRSNLKAASYNLLGVIMYFAHKEPEGFKHR